MQLTKVIIFCLLHKKYTLKIISTPAKKKGIESQKNYSKLQREVLINMSLRKYDEAS